MLVLHKLLADHFLRIITFATITTPQGVVQIKTLVGVANLETVVAPWAIKEAMLIGGLTSLTKDRGVQDKVTGLAGGLMGAGGNKIAQNPHANISMSVKNVVGLVMELLLAGNEGVFFLANVMLG